ncbi:MAG: PLP-dependent aminotransferase family protein [Alphaproteobacteria bacterium]|nr:PLP-dependent aminotransferase family protein [Alphaproteobacteria bacterium]
MSKTGYRKIADQMADDIQAGRLKPGEQLLPQREFAYQRGIAQSTASRVYLALSRKGLVTGEVGRGTYVRSSAAPIGAIALSEPASAPIDLELNFPILSGQADMIARSLKGVMIPDNLATALRPLGSKPARSTRQTIASFLKRGGWAPEPDLVFATGNGRQAIAASLSALAPPGSRIGVEALTYPVILGIAEQLRLDLVPLELDREGIVPAKLADSHRAAPLKAVYFQTYLHNPLGVSMGNARRAELAAVLKDTNLPAVEDAIYSFLVDDPPLALLAPDQVILVDSLSKRIAPGLTLGMIVAPPQFGSEIARAIRSGAWSPSGFALSGALQLMSDGTAGRLQLEKRGDAKKRQKIARSTLAEIELSGDHRAYHILMHLPESWRAEEFVAAAEKLGVSTVSARAFAVSAGYAPNSVRLALASPTESELISALSILREIAIAGPSRKDVG